ncbi:MAG TPA: hypothetical protein P5121_32405 [Caldilineaceae bacterium]|nr:hypothetical protein [Caldilineaceae bacterium]
MKSEKMVVWLSWLIVILALIAVGAAFLWPNDGSPFTVTSLRGQVVQIYGHGLYHYDTRFTGAANRGNDVVTLVLGIPLLIYATLLYRRGSLRGALLLLGTLVYFLYLYSSYALGVAFNPLFLVYIALFSTSFFAFVLLFATIDRRLLADHLAPDLPRRAIAIFMVVSGLATLVIWLVPLLNDLALNQLPASSGTYSTKITDVLDLGIITPVTLIAGRLIWRRNPVGYLIAFSLLVLEIMLTPMIAAQTVSQLVAGITFTPAEILGPMAGFATLGLFALWVMVVLWRKTVETTDWPLPLQPAQG